MALSTHSTALAAGDSSDSSSSVPQNAFPIEDEYNVFDNFTQTDTSTPTTAHQPPAGGQGDGTSSLFATVPSSGPGAASVSDIMVNADDDEWEKRKKKRTYLVKMMKRSESYQKLLIKREADGSADTPRTPDPEDRTITKRNWEMSCRGGSTP